MKKKIIVILIALLFSLSVLSSVEARQLKIIEKRVFIHRAKGGIPGKPDKPGGSDDNGGKLWYKYSGLHWSAQDPAIVYYLDSTGSGLSNAEVKSAVEESFEEWDRYTASEVFADNAILNTVTAGNLDSFNAISFGPTKQGVIGVTSIWYYSSTGQVVEVDTLFSTNYDWSTTGESGKMDLVNIATHEFGHWLVLEDMYNKPANKQTMYGYSTTEETIKRTIESGDVAGIKTIYGD
jgi:hypothetical protein